MKVQYLSIALITSIFGSLVEPPLQSGHLKLALGEKKGASIDFDIAGQIDRQMRNIPKNIDCDRSTIKRVITPTVESARVLMPYPLTTNSLTTCNTSGTIECPMSNS
jgi:hypothetical protein